MKILGLEVKRVKNEINIESINDPVLKALLTDSEIDRKTALSLPAVANAVSYICDTISMIPIKLYQEVKDKEGNKKVIELEDNRVLLLNDDTKDTLDGCQFKRAIVEDYLLGKGGYAYINKTRNVVNKINYIEEKYIVITTNNDPINKRYDILINSKTYKDYQFIKLLRNTKDGASGTGLISQVSKALETAYQNMIYQLNLVKTGGNKRGFLQAKNKLSDEALEKLKEGWQKLYSGNNSNNMIILNDGIEFKEASNSSVEMQINESRKTLNEEIASIFHIKSNYTETFREAIQPILTAFECALNRDLLLEKEKSEGYFFSFDLKEILKGTLKERFEAYKIAKDTGWITKNEIRYLENYDSIEGLDVVDLGLGSVLYDTKKHVYYTPNTNSTTKLGGGGDNGE